MKPKSNTFFTIGLTLMIICIGLIPESNPDLKPPPTKQVHKDTIVINLKK